MLFGNLRLVMAVFFGDLMSNVTVACNGMEIFPPQTQLAFWINTFLKPIQIQKWLLLGLLAHVVRFWAILAQNAQV